MVTSDINAAVQKVHEANIGRYRQILRTPLNDHERYFIERRLAAEAAALNAAAGNGASFGFAAD